MSFQLHLQGDQRRQAKLEPKLQAIVKLIDLFPLHNPHETTTTGLNPDEPQNQLENDMIAQLNLIRSKYKICCTTVGLKSRIQAVSPLSM